MDTLERAIRAALEKGDASDRAYREKVYRSALAALERAVSAPNVSPETGAERRAGLQEIIARIEREHLPPSPPRVAPASSAARPDAAPSIEIPDAHGRRDDAADFVPQRHEPAPQQARTEAGRREPELTVTRDEPLDEYRIDADLDENVEGETRETRRRRGSFAWVFIVITVITILAVGSWWAVSSGVLSPGSQGGGVPNPSPIQDEEGFDPANPNASGSSTAPRLGTQQDVDPTAITLFTPEEPGEISTPGDAVAEVVGEGDAAMLRIRSGRSGSAIAFNVPQETLSQLAGRRSVFVVSARADNDEATQISVSCSFGEMGDCGRQRYDVGSQRSDFIFDVDLPSVQPGSDGTIAIVSDIDNAGKALDIYAIRVSAE